MGGARIVLEVMLPNLCLRSDISQTFKAGPEDINLFFVLNTAEHEI